jgi:hypothetical protein
VINNLSGLTMPNLRRKDNKRKSDTFIVENVTRPETERNVKVAIGSHFNSLKLKKILKKENIENLKLNCTCFLQEVCAFGDNECWFRHPKTNQIQRNVLRKILDFKCGICIRKFNRKKDCMKLRKEEH